MSPEDFAPPPAEGTIEEQLIRAARDLWTMVLEQGESYIVLMDRRRMSARVQHLGEGRFGVMWETEDGDWTPYEAEFDNLREAAFHAYQGPH